MKRTLSTTIRYFWGNDLSGTEQGAGNAPVAKRTRRAARGRASVASSPCPSMGRSSSPCYDHNGNIVCYVSESGSIAAQYVYAPYGNVVEQYGSNPNLFNFGFSTKYLDREVDLVGYQYRFLRPSLGRWLNRDPIGEEGGENLYAFCANNAVWSYDKDGCAYFAKRGLGGGPRLRWSYFISCPFLGFAVDIAADLLNVELVHEQLFFEDGQNLSSVGWSSDGELRNESMRGYVKTDGNSNDNLV